MEVFAFIDTNVLLHYRFFRDVDWAAALDEPEVVLVLAPVVHRHHVWAYAFLTARTQDGRVLKILIERWRREYNPVRPHSALGYRRRCCAVRKLTRNVPYPQTR